MALEGVATGWASVDVEAAMGWVDGLDGDAAQRHEAMAAALLSGAQADPTVALELAVGWAESDLLALAERPKHHMPPLTRAFQALAEDEPSRTFELFAELPASALEKMLAFYDAWTPFRDLLATDLDRALQLGELLDEGSKGWIALISDVGLALTHTDTARALGLAERLSGPRKKWLIEECVRRWDDPAAAARFMLREREYYTSFRMDNAMRELAARDHAGAEEALEILGQIAVEDRDGRRAEVLAGMATHDADRAMAMAAGLDDRGRAQWAVVEAWAGADREGFQAWLAEAPDELHAIGLAAQGAALMRDDPASAARFLSRAVQVGPDQLGASEIRYRYRTMAEVLMRQDLGHAVDWVVGLGGAEVSGVAVEAIARQSLEVDAPGTSEWIAELPAGKVRDMAAVWLVENLQERDPEAAFAWAMSIGETEGVGDRVLGSSARTFYRDQPQEAIEQITAMAPGESRDEALRYVIPVFAQDDPEAAFALALTVSDRAMRGARLSEALSQVRDAERRQALIDSLPESEPAKKRFTRPLGGIQINGRGIVEW